MTNGNNVDTYDMNGAIREIELKALETEFKQGEAISAGGDGAELSLQRSMLASMCNMLTTIRNMDDRIQDLERAQNP